MNFVDRTITVDLQLSVGVTHDASLDDEEVSDRLMDDVDNYVETLVYEHGLEGSLQAEVEGYDIIGTKLHETGEEY